MKYLLLVSLLLVGLVACAVPDKTEPKKDCCGNEVAESTKDRDAERAARVSEGKAYFDKTGKFHDHATTAFVWTVCNCKVCDRKDKCCGPNHCICAPD